MAEANVGIQMAGKRVDLSGSIPDSVALEMVSRITDLLIAPPILPTDNQEPQA